MDFATTCSSSQLDQFPPPSFPVHRDAAAFDMLQLDQALVLFLDDEQQKVRPETLSMIEEPSSSISMPSFGLVSDRSSQPSIDFSRPPRERNCKKPLSTSQQAADPKTLRRLVQNREAARKSRLKKKAYVQELESSRMRLAQLEEEIQRARAQGFYLGGMDEPGLLPNTNSEAAMFDVEYGRWLEEQHILTEELHRGLVHDMPENELALHVDNYLAHYDRIIQLKSVLAKSDVFHLISGAWKTPAERFFLWLGGSRPSELIKIAMSGLAMRAEEETMGRICGLQRTTAEEEERLSVGLESLENSLSEALICDSLAIPPNVDHYMAQMGVAIDKLSTLERFVGQADNLRQETLNRLRRILSAREAALCFVAMAEYFHRLRALSSLWILRPRHS